MARLWYEMFPSSLEECRCLLSGIAELPLTRKFLLEKLEGEGSDKIEDCDVERSVAGTARGKGGSRDEGGSMPALRQENYVSTTQKTTKKA